MVLTSALPALFLFLASAASFPKDLAPVHVVSEAGEDSPSLANLWGLWQRAPSSRLPWVPLDKGLASLPHAPLDCKPQTCLFTILSSFFHRNLGWRRPQGSSSPPPAQGRSPYPIRCSLLCFTLPGTHLYPSFRGLGGENDSDALGLDFQSMLQINQTLFVAAR